MTIRRQYAGFSLIETLVGVSLALVAVTMAVPLLHWCTLTLHQTEREATSNAVFDHAIDLLRRDVWQAHSIAQASDQLTLTSPAGRVVWEFDTDGTFRRHDASDAPQHWMTGIRHVRVTQNGAAVTFAIPDAPGHLGYAIGIIHPASLYSEAHP